MDEQQVILVDNNDEQVGIIEKIQAHKNGLLHRAFSIFIFNSKGEMLLQRRALNKYHSGGLWTNTCCSHPRPGESISHSAQARLKEEMGFETSLEKISCFIYKAECENGLTEHELDHVFAGEYDGPVDFSKEEVMDFCYKDLQEIQESLQTHPQKYSVWFHLAFPEIENWWNQRYNNKMA
ncbi:MAG TPA: isopentenyl-diphosphate Delta-isomerase [Chitinophagaceae bacterium]|nr:isopentenyl-diphosphate Delta-isomerase [Chitinophagaceae bacterium]